MKSVVILSKSELYYGNNAAVARMNLYARSSSSNINKSIKLLVNFFTKDLFPALLFGIYVLFR